ncbi:MAG: DUF3494 domain-containing protein [Saprospiraceae bacterium]|nr:DUF3494 domain-containing protein [Saprospiraceae bacterium]
MKNNKLLTAIAMVSAVFIWGCQKDDFKEITGVCPVVESTSPENLIAGVPLNQVVSVTFNTEMDPATITTSSITLFGATQVAGTISYSGRTAYFTPSSILLPNVVYTGTVNTSVKDVTGNALQTDYVWTFSTGAIRVDLKTSARFGVLAATGISSVGVSEIRNMDVGLSPGIRSAITGFPPAIVLNGAIYAADDATPAGVQALLLQSKSDLADAYIFAQSAVIPAFAAVSGDLGGKTLLPGIYKSSTTLRIQSGDLILDAQGDVDAVWIFQVAADFFTVGEAGGNVVLAGGAQAKNIFWQTGGSATIGNLTAFQGTLLALTSITMNPGATTTGHLFALNGAVVLTNTNIINKP